VMDAILPNLDLTEGNGDRVQKYRNRAKECRTIAEKMNVSHRETMKVLAADWDRMADLLEKIDKL